MTNRHITVLVSNDLEFDQRVSKVCRTLLDLGWKITLVGRRLPQSSPLNLPYETRRFRLPFHRGVFFYAALNLRLFFYLLGKKTDVILANDLDTLLPAFLISRLRRKVLVYDSHEYFTEAEGLTGRTFQKNVWLSVERWIFPKLKYVITVNESIAEIYRNKYRVHVRVVRNVPELREKIPLKSAKELGLPEEKTVLILQGAYIDPDRGAAEAIQSTSRLNNVLLLIIGSGREMPRLRQMASSPEFADKVIIRDRMSFDELRHFTGNADIGLSLDKPVHLNYLYSLPNKLFDYIHAGIPVLASDLPELRRIVEQYEVGEIIPETHPDRIAEAVEKMRSGDRMEKYRECCRLASKELNWEKEREVLIEVYTEVAAKISY